MPDLLIEFAPKIIPAARSPANGEAVRERGAGKARTGMRALPDL